MPVPGIVMIVAAVAVFILWFAQRLSDKSRYVGTLIGIFAFIISLFVLLPVSNMLRYLTIVTAALTFVGIIAYMLIEKDKTKAAWTSNFWPSALCAIAILWGGGHVLSHILETQKPAVFLMEEVSEKEGVRKVIMKVREMRNPLYPPSIVDSNCLLCICYSGTIVNKSDHGFIAQIKHGGEKQLYYAVQEGDEVWFEYTPSNILFSMPDYTAEVFTRTKLVKERLK
ncbi:hypothetical protein KA005_26135 [bacterium]|nr:hypothetical protein [bacterium]